LSNPRTGDRVLTTSEYERRSLSSKDFVYEGILGYACSLPGYSSDAITYYSVYRYYNHSKKEHFYTNNFYELGSGNYGYEYEGVAFALLR
jgi:hypothetical protein